MLGLNFVVKAVLFSGNEILSRNPRPIIVDFPVPKTTQNSIFIKNLHFYKLLSAEMTVYSCITGFPNLNKLLKFALKPKSKYGFLV